MMIYSNETIGELLTFQYFDISTNAVYNMPQTLDFEANMIEGNVVDPFIFVFTPMSGDILGCTDELACNYYSFATEDDGSCTYAEENFDCDGDCISPIDCAGVCGGLSEVDCAGECNGSAVEDECGVCDNSPWNDCEQDCNGEWGGNAVEDECGVCDGLGLNDDGCCGCTIETACNYDSSALLNNGLCEYPETFYDCNGICLTDSDGDNICNELEIEGCTDVDACNYNPAATEDDGSCDYADES
jgi:hypothetical protein